MSPQALSTMTTNDGLEMIFLGTGTSATVPSIQCLTDPKRGCFCCRSTLDKTDDRAKRNIRRNTSALIKIPSSKTGAGDGRSKTLLIDCGKSFLTSALEHWPKHGLREIDALLITHAHADAMLGLDDLRGWTLHGIIQQSVPIYCTQDTYDEIAKCFPYLTDSMKATGGGDVPAFEWRIFDQSKPMTILGIDVVPLPVHHGKIFSEPGQPPYICLGYLFDRQIVYLSDVSLIPENVWDVLRRECLLPEDDRGSNEESIRRSLNNLTVNGAKNGIDTHNGSSGSQVKRRVPILVIDCLRIETFTSHFGFGEAVAAARRLGAARTYMLERGMRTSLAVDPNVRLPIEKEKWRVMNGSPDPTKEDWSVHTDYSLRAVESYEQGYKGGLWIRPACDGMTVRVSHDDRIADDVYNA
ncbi:hypothetical protein OIO90_006476 [Microbotryomycetes sp. JL221]|nr:hypothetical protein OIO90_006476 [Microbotryomycetes sp. JL221]